MFYLHDSFISSVAKGEIFNAADCVKYCLDTIRQEITVIQKNIIKVKRVVLILFNPRQSLPPSIIY